MSTLNHPPSRPGAEIDPVAFERELRAGADVVVIDTRDRDAYAEWHVDAGDVRLLNVPEAELVADPKTTLSGIPSDARSRPCIPNIKITPFLEPDAPRGNDAPSPQEGRCWGSLAGGPAPFQSEILQGCDSSVLYISF